MTKRVKCKFRFNLEHINPPICNCIKQAHRYKDKICLCITQKYCVDAVKSVDQSLFSQNIDLSKFT